MTEQRPIVFVGGPADGRRQIVSAETFMRGTIRISLLRPDQNLRESPWRHAETGLPVVHLVYRRVPVPIDDEEFSVWIPEHQFRETTPETRVQWVMQKLINGYRKEGQSLIP